MQGMAKQVVMVGLVAGTWKEQAGRACFRSQEEQHTTSSFFFIVNTSICTR